MVQRPNFLWNFLMPKNSRRNFLKQSTGAAATVSGFGFLSNLPLVTASEGMLAPDLVDFGNGIEPTVQLIEKTPRAELLEKMAVRVKAGLSYREVLAALLLAGIRNVQPSPSVGFKFHCVLVVNSCHLASLSGPDSDRWLPIFWALDYFKSSQADESNRSGWRMSPVKESLVPNATNVRKVFADAMESWDVEKADAATAGLCRTVGATEVFNLFAKYAARDYRSIGHKAIYLANSWRTLQVIGWDFAEPVLRSLAFALLNHNGETNPSKSDHAVDRPWRENIDVAQRFPKNWLDGKIDHAVPSTLMEGFRSGSPSEISGLVSDIVNNGISPQSIWDGVFVGAGELLMRQPGIIGLHGLTTANAMHYLWRNVQSETLRKQLLLQACAFNPLFRDSAKGRGKLGDQTVETLKSESLKSAGKEAVEEILSEVSSNRMKAAKKLRGYLESGGNSHHFVNESRKVLFRKGRDAHDYKFSSAVLEDYVHISPKWRDDFLAMSVFNLKGSGHPDNKLNQRVKSSLS